MRITKVIILANRTGPTWWITAHSHDCNLSGGLLLNGSGEHLQIILRDQLGSCPKPGYGLPLIKSVQCNRQTRVTFAVSVVSYNADASKKIKIHLFHTTTKKNQLFSSLSSHNRCNCNKSRKVSRSNCSGNRPAAVGTTDEVHYIVLGR